ncbi:MAG TPA: TetR/AcrR family transcriptional regulator [Jiangellaceae bacterium]
MTPRRRQAERSQSTRQALIAVARALFTERGYANVSAEEIVAAAGLTRGALGHHFGDKRGLFLAVFEQVEQEVTERILNGIGEVNDAWSGLARGFTCFLDACEDQAVVQIALIDAPAVLGWADWRAIEAEHGLGLIRAGLEQAMSEGLLARQPVDVLARLLLSAATEAALLVAQAGGRATHRTVMRVVAERALLDLLTGLRTSPDRLAEAPIDRTGVTADPTGDVV